MIDRGTKEKSSIFTTRHVNRVKDLIRKFKNISSQLDIPRKMLDTLVDGLIDDRIQEITLDTGTRYIGEFKGNKRDGKGKNT